MARIMIDYNGEEHIRVTAKNRSIKSEKPSWKGMMSLSELSEKTGISIDCLKSYSSGRRDLRKASYETVEKIADALGVDIRSLF